MWKRWLCGMIAIVCLRPAVALPEATPEEVPMAVAVESAEGTGAREETEVPEETETIETAEATEGPGQSAAEAPEATPAPALLPVTFVFGEEVWMVQVVEGDAVACPETPAAEGRTFLHWAASEEETALPYDFAAPVHAPLTLYAWHAPLPELTQAPDPAPEPEAASEPEPLAQAMATAEPEAVSFVVVDDPAPEAVEATARRVDIVSDALGVLREGDTVTLRGVLHGYDGLQTQLQWQQGWDGVWADVPGATEPAYALTIGPESAAAAWRLMVTIVR